jgi:methyl-accepting chemotaxis protein
LPNSFSLAGIRAKAAKIFVWVVWAHVLVAGAVALLARNRWQEPMAVALACALVATLAAWKLRDGFALRAVLAICVTMGPIIFVYAARGHSSGIAGNGDWQIDYHMYFFGVFAMLTAFIDWRPIAVSAALTAAHHLLLDLGALFKRLEELVDFTSRETAEALMREMEINAALQARLDAHLAPAEA